MQFKQIMFLLSPSRALHWRTSPKTWTWPIPGKDFSSCWQRPRPGTQAVYENPPAPHPALQTSEPACVLLPPPLRSLPLQLIPHCSQTAPSLLFFFSFVHCRSPLLHFFSSPLLLLPLSPTPLWHTQHHTYPNSHNQLTCSSHICFTWQRKMENTKEEALRDGILKVCVVDWGGARRGGSSLQHITWQASQFFLILFLFHCFSQSLHLRWFLTSRRPRMR